MYSFFDNPFGGIGLINETDSQGLFGSNLFGRCLFLGSYPQNKQKTYLEIAIEKRNAESCLRLRDAIRH